MRVHQIAYGMMMGDAISNHALAIDACVRSWGWKTAVYAQHVAPEMHGRVLPDNQFIPHLSNTDDLLIYHYSIYSPNVRLFRAFQGKRVLIYHNITPAHYFTRWDAQQADLCTVGRQTLRALVDADFALGDSEFNRMELVAAGFEAEKTAVLPIFFAPNQYHTDHADAAFKSRLQQNDINWLTVGRIVPNKALEDVIRLFAVYRRYHQATAHLHLVGSRYLPRYDAALTQLAADLGLQEVVHFGGRVSDAELQAYYETADLYITASRHEGFCVPLLESMMFGVPILARSSSAVPETLGAAGVLFTDSGYDALAEMAHIMVSDTAVRQQIIQTQKARWQQLQAIDLETHLRQLFSRMKLV